MFESTEQQATRDTVSNFVARRLRLITLTSVLIIADTTKSMSNIYFIKYCFKESNDKRFVEEANGQVFSYFAADSIPLTTRELDIAHGNHALRAQPTDYSLTASRLVNIP